jgi:type II secretory pathway component PulJ
MTRILRRLAREQAGVTLIELIVGAALSLIVFGATLTVFSAVQRTRAATEEHNERQQDARVAVDRLARDLRNLASPSDFNNNLGAAPLGVDRNGRYDIVYKTVDGTVGSTTANTAAVKRVRYCLDTSNASRHRLLMQEQTSATYTSTPPSDTACPGAGWTGEPRVMADHISNVYGGRDRPVFTYSTDDVLLPYDQPGAMTNTTRVSMRLWLDAKPGDSPVEANIASAVLLRNQNRPPTAVMIATPQGRTIQLNGTSSSDPENQPLKFDWYSGTEPLAANRLNLEGEGGLTHTLLDQAPGTYVFILKVTDSAGTEVLSEPATVTVV